MKGLFVAVMLAAILVFGCISQPPPATPTPTPAATNTPAATATPEWTQTPEPTAAAAGCPPVITACCNITSPGEYTLGGNLSSEGLDACVTITSGGSGSVLDCDGHSMIGTDRGYGIFLDRASRVTVRDCALARFESGIYLYSPDSTANNITGNSAARNYDGIKMQESSYNSITNNNADANIYGIFASNSRGNAIIGNGANSNGAGIYLDGSDNCTVANNTAYANRNAGIKLSSSQGNIFANNSLVQNIFRDNFLCGSGSTEEGSNVDGGGNTCGEIGACHWLTCH